MRVTQLLFAVCCVAPCRASHLDFEIVVVEDSSPDGTLAVAEMLQVILHPFRCHAQTFGYVGHGVYCMVWAKRNQ